MEDTPMLYSDNVQKQEEKVAINEKYNLTIKEASQYLNIGEKKIRQLIENNCNPDFILMNGTKTLIKRKKFEQFIDDSSAI